MSLDEATEPPSKRQCTTMDESTRPPLKIGTHNGTFHCDEVLACHMLKLLPEYSDSSIVRTRDPEVLNQCDIVVDVGGLYDPAKHCYDHHQRSFNESMSSLTDNVKPWVTKLSSAGLIYHHFGNRVISILTGHELSSPNQIKLYDAVYSNFVEEVDAVDNGIEDREGIPKYNIRSTIGYRVRRLNPVWSDPNQDTDERFYRAVKVVGEEFNDIVKYYKDSWLPARTVIESAFKERFKVDPSGEILKLERFCPWTEHLFEVESEMSVESDIKFVLYQERGTSKWRVQSVPISNGSFVCRVPLLEKWRGIRDNQLTELSGIPGCIFVHANGFIGGNESMEGALKMAQMTLEASRSS